MDDCVIKVNDLSKRFGSIVALDHLTLSIPRGITYGLVGPNGSGKTTLIKILTGLLKPSTGEALVFNQLPGRADARKRIGYMPQLEALYLDLTVEENLHFFSSIYGLHGKERLRRVSDALALVDLNERRHSKVDQLSGGMRQRLSLSCALLHEPELLILDEPTVGVDPELRQIFWNYFQVVTQEGVTLVLSTHYLEEAGRCTRLAMLRSGKLLVEDDPQRITQLAGEQSLERAFLVLGKEREHVT